MKATELREFSPEELQHKQQELIEELFNLRFQLATGNPGGFKGLQRILPETDLIPTTCLASHPTPVLFTKFRLFRHQHGSGTPR